MAWAWHSTGVILSHGLSTAASAGQGLGLLAQGSRCHREMCSWAVMGYQSQCPPHQEGPRGLSRAGSGERTLQSQEPAPMGLSTQGRCRRASSHSLTHQTGRCTGSGFCSAGRSS